VPRPPSALLLTATITPDERVPLLKARDPQQRLQEYLAALDFYLGLPTAAIGPIVFAENSQSDLSAVSALAERRGAAGRFEALHVPGGPPELGRGVGEARLVRDAIELSPTLQAVTATQQIWKVTGRYTVRNLAKLARTAPDCDLYINLRRRPTSWCDTWAYAFTREGYARCLAGATEAIAATAGTGEKGERTMARLVEELLRSGADVRPRLRYEARIQGIRGIDLVPYDDPKQRLKYLARIVAKRVAPSLWI
jgi:hypothetical protein